VALLLTTVGCSRVERAKIARGDNPGVVILTPADGSSIEAGDIEVNVRVFNFRIVDKRGQKPARGEGHIVFYLDVASGDVPTATGRTALTSRGKYLVSPNLTHRWSAVTRGEHSLAVQLVNNDDTPLSSPEFAWITVSVT
jgi:hypothetical protein